MPVENPKLLNKFLKSINSPFRACMVCGVKISVDEYLNQKKLCEKCYQEWVVKL